VGEAPVHVRTRAHVERRVQITDGAVANDAGTVWKNLSRRRDYRE
jgi:hypothetical protein